MHKVPDSDTAFFIATLLTKLYDMVRVLFTCGKPLYDHIISLRMEVWAIKLV